MVQSDCIYYDDRPTFCLSATCIRWSSCEHNTIEFKSWAQFEFFLATEIEFAYELIQITDDNYQALCLQGIFNEQ